MTNTDAVIVALPPALEPIRLAGDEEKHATILYFGATASLPDDAKTTILESLATAANMFMPFSEETMGTQRLGVDVPPALVTMLSGRCLCKIRDALQINPAIVTYMDNATQHPNYQPHMTLGYPDWQAETDLKKLVSALYEVRFDRIALWWNDERFEFPLGAQDRGMARAMSDMSHDALTQVGSFLEHVGVKGMKWGIRKAEQNYGVTYIKPKSFKETYAKEIAAAGKLSPIEKLGLHLVNRDAAKADKRMLEGDLKILNKKLPIAKLDKDGHPVSGTLFEKTSDLHAVLDKPGSRAFEITDNPGPLITQHEIRIETGDKAEHRVVYSLTDNGVKHSDLMVGAFLEHHGIKGMKWGIRRNRDSGGTAERKADTGSTSNASDSGNSTVSTTHISADAERFIKTRQKAGVEMSDVELRAALNRAQMAKQYDDFFGSKPNSELQMKVNELQLKKQYSDLQKEMTPQKKSVVKKFISASNSAYDAYSKLDKVTGGELSKQIGSQLHVKFNPEQAARDRVAAAAKAAGETRKNQASVEKAVAEAKLAGLKVKEKQKALKKT